LKKKYVLDSGILPLYFAGRSDVGKFINDIYKGLAEGYMCEINVTEFLYNYARVFDWDAAVTKNRLLRTSPIRIVGVDENMSLEAAKLKLKRLTKLSLADCYLIALAKQLRATILTTDSTIQEYYKKTILFQI